jgi:hypothetical protein
MTWKTVGSKGFVVDADASEKEHGYVSVNKKNCAKGYLQYGLKHIP